MVEDGSEAGSQFSAAAPALGYLAQVEYALLLTLRRMDVEDSFSVSMETFDDVVFHDSETDEASELLQSKYATNTSKSLSDASTDLWKTIHNWIAERLNSDARLVLFATTNAGPTAAKLGPVDRDEEGALRALEATARTSTSRANQDYYNAFLGLSDESRRALVSRIEIIDRAPGLDEIHEHLAKAVRKSVIPQRREALLDRLRAWWHIRAIQHLGIIARHGDDRITDAEVEAKLLELADSLRDENLPIDVLSFGEPTEEQVSEDDRIFVAQLRLISLSSQRLRKCIFDHNRAFAQRSRWQRDQLLEVGELDKYDRELVEAWKSYFLPLTDLNLDSMEDHEIQAQARDAYNALDQSNLVPIRRDVTTGFVARGSLQMISDRLEIGWHPQWLDHLRSRLAEARESGDLTA